MTETLRGYAMHHLGDGIWRNEIEMRDSILRDNDERYLVYPVRVDSIARDNKKDELNIGLEKIAESKSKIKYHGFTLFSQDAIDEFLDDTDIDDPGQLLNRNFIGLFTNANSLKWLIAYPYSVTELDINTIKIDAGDASYLHHL